MLTAFRCLLIALTCQSVGGVAALRETRAAAQAAAGRPIVLSLTCTLSRRASTVSCAPAGTYAVFVVQNLKKDTVRQIWSFDASVQNLLRQPIGTLDGTTATGATIFVTGVYATEGRGAVSVIHPDGAGNLTGPSQPYFNYSQILQAGASSKAKRWMVSVPNSVTVLRMEIRMTADFPAEQTVTLVPPDTVAAWVHADTNIASGTDSTAGGFAKHIVKVRFRPTASLADRQLAIALVNGVIVGGWHTADGSLGFYYVKVADDGTGDGIAAAARVLTALPQVQSAVFVVNLGPASKTHQLGATGRGYTTLVRRVKFWSFGCWMGGRAV
jgi:hypothetical protein